MPQICGLTADGDGKYSMVAVVAVCKWLTTAGNPLRSLKLGQNQLCAPKPKQVQELSAPECPRSPPLMLSGLPLRCGVNWKGWGEYTSVAVEALCEAVMDLESGRKFFFENECRARAAFFTEARFQSEMKAAIETAVAAAAE